MIIKNLQLDGVKELIPSKFNDNRGYFTETFRQSNLNDFIIKQENTTSNSLKGTLRGIHLQLGDSSQAKLVSCTRGRILDVYVDLRKKSKTFGKWGSLVLSDTLNNQIFIPKGFGHAFITLVDNCKVSYKVDEYYNKKFEYTIKWNDESLNINWGISNPIISNKDSIGSSFHEYIKIITNII